jgi:uncharacterized membrane protein (DUF485 family)
MTHHDLTSLSRARLRIALTLSVCVVVLYFGFISLIAFKKELLGRLVMPGLSLGILLGVIVIVGSWLLTWVYVRWANRHYDAALRDFHHVDRP